MRILHITDLHILEDQTKLLYGVDTLAAACRVLDQAFNLEQAPQMIIATGDIAEDGAEASYSHFIDMTRGYDVPVFVVPGNHDSATAMKQVFHGTHILMPFEHYIGGWKILFLDSAIKNQEHGRIDERQRKAVIKSLTADPEMPTMICLHHTPISICPLASCQFDDVHGWLSELSTFPNVKIIAGGHLHANHRVPFGSFDILSTPSTAVQVRHPIYHNSDDDTASHDIGSLDSGCRIIDLMGGGKFSTSVHWAKPA